MIYTSSEDDPDANSSDLGLPPRPPSNRSKDKSFVSGSPEIFSPSPSSGHFSGGSAMSKSPGETQESLIARLRREIDSLKAKFTKADKDWAAEKQDLMLEISRIQSSQPQMSSSHMEDINQEKLRLAVIEQKIKEILIVLKSLNSMVRTFTSISMRIVLISCSFFQKISNKILGSLVVNAVESAYDSMRGEVDVVRFLHLLYESTRDYERNKADHLLSDALDAVADYGDSNESDSDNTTGLSTILRPRGIADQSFFRIDV